MALANYPFSQPFWGNMVAAAGAGPQPIPHRSLDANKLADAILYCLRPESLSAAENISITMQTETGVKTAVESFHRNLPLDKMRCHMLPDEPAVWTYKKSLTKPLQLSKTAAQILVDQLRIEPKSLKWSVVSI